MPQGLLHVLGLGRLLLGVPVSDVPAPAWGVQMRFLGRPPACRAGRTMYSSSTTDARRGPSKSVSAVLYATILLDPAQISNTTSLGPDRMP